MTPEINIIGICVTGFVVACLFGWFCAGIVQKIKSRKK